MRENEFERKVQAQMEELRIRPSDETWERVEKELREKKKRRGAVLFFIMAGLLLLGYSGYTFLSTSSNQPVARNEEKKSSGETVRPTLNTPANTTNTTTYNNSAVAEKSGTTPITNHSHQIRNASPSLKLENVAIVRENAADRRKKKNVISQKENNAVISTSTEAAIFNKHLDQTEKNQVQQPANKKENIITNSIVSNTIGNKDQAPADSAAAIDSTVAKTEVNKTEAPEPGEPKPAITKIKNKSGLKLGVEVSGGFISSQNRFFGFDGRSQYKLNDLQQSGPVGTPGGVGTGTGGARVIIPPSHVNAGRAWKIGLVAEKGISKRSSLSAGLRYSYADESLEVGAIRDTIVRSNSYSFSQNFLAASGVRSAYSSAAAAPRAPVKYTNRYHFLEIPLSYQTQLNKGKKVGILWNAGIAPGFLIGTNALVYDTAATGVYYRNDNAFKRFHFNMQTGFTLQFGNSKKIQWSLGPTVSMDMTRLMKEDVFTEKRYFLYTGLTGRVFLNSRKK
jgi:hypothetical protein